MFGAAQIAGHQHRPAAGFLDPARGFLGVLVLLKRSDQHIGAFARKGDRHRAANARIPAGYSAARPLSLSLPR